MRNSRLWTVMVVVAVLLITTTVSGAATLADTGTTAIDASHDLTGQSAIDAYEADGVASAQVDVPQLRLTVAEGHDDVGLSGFHFDFDKKYVRFQYNESLNRTIRVYVPSEYFYPISAKIDSDDGDTTATFRPTEDGRYTAITVQFDGEADAVFAVPKAASFVFFGRSKARSSVENATGYEPPQIASSGSWAIVPDGQLDGNASYPINASKGHVVQYNAGSSAEEDWVSVPGCGVRSGAPVCLYEKAGVDDKLFVLSRTSDAPTVRFKTESDLSADARGEGNELFNIPSQFWEDVTGILGGSLFGGGEDA